MQVCKRTASSNKIFLWTAQLSVNPIMTPTLILLENGLVNTSSDTSKQMPKSISVPALQTVPAAWHTSTERKKSTFSFWNFRNY